MGITISELKAELFESERAASYASYLSVGQDKELAELLNTKNISSNKIGEKITELGILDLLGPVAGNAFLEQLETVAASNKIIERVLRILKQSAGIGTTEPGIDLGNLSVQAMLSQLALAGVINVASKNALIAKGTTLLSRIEVLFGPGNIVTENQIGHARND